MLSVKTTQIMISACIVAAFSGCSEPRRDTTLELAAAVGRAAQSVRVPEYRWCPPTVNGRTLTHSVWRESDTLDPALVCFYK